MDGCLVTVIVVLDVLLEAAFTVYGEDVAISGVVVERVAVYMMRSLFGGQQKDCASLCVCIVCLG